MKDPNLNSLTASTSSTSSIRHAAYTKGLSVFVNLHVRIYTGFFLVALSLLVYAVSVPSVGVAIAMGYVMGIGDATAQSGIYVSCVCESFLLLYINKQMTSHYIHSLLPSYTATRWGYPPSLYSCCLIRWGCGWSSRWTTTFINQGCLPH